LKIPVIRAFIDKNTKKPYNQGYVYESDNIERIKELQDKGFLKDVKTDSYPKHTGGGWYELSNGEKVQGKDEAIAAEKKLGD
jgi:hypothetical protein